jgi:hypothetical protein
MKAVLFIREIKYDSKMLQLCAPHHLHLTPVMLSIIYNHLRQRLSAPNAYISQTHKEHNDSTVEAKPVLPILALSIAFET